MGYNIDGVIAVYLSTDDQKHMFTKMDDLDANEITGKGAIKIRIL